jgi:hypothetical protein
VTLEDEIIRTRRARFEEAGRTCPQSTAVLKEISMMKEIDISYRTMFAELAQRTLDAQFAADFSLEGWFVVKDRDYWYFDLPTPEGKDKRSYVGPHSDEAITERVKAHKEIKGTSGNGGAWLARSCWPPRSRSIRGRRHESPR